MRVHCLIHISGANMDSGVGHGEVKLSDHDEVFLFGGNRVTYAVINTQLLDVLFRK